VGPRDPLDQRGNPPDQGGDPLDQGGDPLDQGEDPLDRGGISLDCSHVCDALHLMTQTWRVVGGVRDHPLSCGRLDG